MLGGRGQMVEQSTEAVVAGGFGRERPASFAASICPTHKPQAMDST